MNARIRRSVVFAAALCAWLMLSCAFVRSTVMQAASAAPAAAMPMCGGDARTAATAPHGPAAPAPAKGCPYCAVATHAPLALNAAPPATCPASVAFVAYRLDAPHGPRGPPERRSRARDPPPIA